jgi:hypothetical protein
MSDAVPGCDVCSAPRGFGPQTADAGRTELADRVSIMGSTRVALRALKSKHMVPASETLQRSIGETCWGKQRTWVNFSFERKQMKRKKTNEEIFQQHAYLHLDIGIRHPHCVSSAATTSSSDEGGRAAFQLWPPVPCALATLLLEIHYGALQG